MELWEELRERLLEPGSCPGTASGAPRSRPGGTGTRPWAFDETGASGHPSAPASPCKNARTSPGPPALPRPPQGKVAPFPGSWWQVRGAGKRGPDARALLIQGLNDTFNKPVDKISPNMTGVLCVYSVLFMRFAWVIQPRNYLLFSCHASNEGVQLNQMRRWGQWRVGPDYPQAAPASLLPAAAKAATKPTS